MRPRHQGDDVRTGTDPFAAGGFIRRHLPEIGFGAASTIWAAVIIDNGDIAWPLLAWMGTALAPMVAAQAQAPRRAHVDPLAVSPDKTRHAEHPAGEGRGAGRAATGAR
jgi:hypothetical protein